MLMPRRTSKRSQCGKMIVKGYKGPYVGFTGCNPVCNPVSYTFHAPMLIDYMKMCVYRVRCEIFEAFN